MKKRTKIIIVLSVVLAVVAALLGIFLSGNTLITDVLVKSPAEQIKILEVQYKITKKTIVLRNLCDALYSADEEENSYEYHEKRAHYFGLYLEGGNELDRSSFAMYIFSLSIISETEKIKTEIDNYLKKDLSDRDFDILYFTLLTLQRNGSPEEKEYAKEVANRILDGSYLKSNSKTEYEELVNKYKLLAEQS